MTLACAAAVAIAAWLVRRYSPEASGSGIPDVESVLHEELPPAPFTVLPVKFFGGLLAIRSGLALGREGPSAHLVGALTRRQWPDARALLAAGAAPTSLPRSRCRESLDSRCHSRRSRPAPTTLEPSRYT